jgi:hypothetical protein
MPTYTTPLPEAVLWHDLDRLAQEKGVLTLFRKPEHHYLVATKPPQFRIQKTMPLKFQTICWTEAMGSIGQQDGTNTGNHAGGLYRRSTDAKLGRVCAFLLFWPPLWFMILVPYAWIWALPVTLLFGSIIVANVYSPVWSFRSFLLNRWQLKSIKP